MLIVIIEEASRRIPHMVISADAQYEQYQLGGGSEKNTSQVCATSCTKTDLSWDLDGQTKSFMHEGHSSQVLLRVIEIDDSSFIHSFIHLIILGRMTCEHRQ